MDSIVDGYSEFYEDEVRIFLMDYIIPLYILKNELTSI